MSPQRECLGKVLSLHLSHITFITENASTPTLVTEPVLIKSSTVSEPMRDESDAMVNDTNEEKIGRLVPVSNINASNKLQIYVDKAVQVGSPSGLFDQTPDIDDLPSNVQLTYNLVDQYIQNLYKTKNALFKLPSFPRLPDDVWTDILTNRFVDIGRIHRAYTMSTKNYVIATFEDWYISFEAYEEGVCLAFPHRKEEFNAWRNSILKLFGTQSENQHIYVIRMESFHRQLIFDQHKRCLDDEKSLGDLYSSFAAPSEAIPTTIPSPTLKERIAKSEPKRERTMGICRKWNTEGCPFRDNCKYKHVCKKCHSEEHIAKACSVRKVKINPEAKTIA
ncbi:hypothetical protein RhiJN_01733 [Ceratobasidium sp. AG-Ba]|nr:hypothetical protein RhiJN_01733 [Ceratobasidium sp. AG-Ba]QRW02660.1 hypothetical protein RhiLY_01659 [Ceratobasidium sp. AG-Ba]